MLVRLAIIGVVVCAVVLGGCAQTGPLTGGPADTTAPIVVFTEPSHRSTNVRTSSIRMVFSDYVDRSVRSAVRIQPAARFSVAYAGDEIDIDLREPLLNSTTYILTLGTQYTSRYGVPPKEGYTLVFSTGNRIDTGVIAGSVLSPTLSGFEIFCIPVLADTIINVRRVPPPYRIAIGSTGSFRLEGLRDGEYRIVAVRDANANGVLDSDEDYATATAAVVVRNGVSRPLTLRPAAPVDSVGPFIRRVRANAARTVELQASERIGTVYHTRISVRDSAGTRTLATDTALFSRDGRDRIILRLVDSLGRGSFQLLIGDSAMVDEAGNGNLDTLRVHRFTGSDRPDSMMRRAVIDTVTASPRDVGSILGVFTDSVQRSPSYLLRLIDSKGAPVHALAVRHGSAVRFDSVRPGEYRVDVVIDRNGNGRYDAGDVYPWKHAEEVVELPVALLVRPRWAQEGVRFDMPITSKE